MPRRVTLKLREVIDGCKLCGRRMLTPDSPLIRRTCAACKAEQRRAHNAKVSARRKAARHAIKAKLGKPRCEQCGKPIKHAVRLGLTRSGPRWTRKFCDGACRQAAFRATEV